MESQSLRQSRDKSQGVLAQHSAKTRFNDLHVSFGSESCRGHPFSASEAALTQRTYAKMDWDYQGTHAANAIAPLILNPTINIQPQAAHELSGTTDRTQRSKSGR